MASENEEIKEELQPKVDALKGEIGDLEGNLGNLNAALTSSIRNIEKIKAQQLDVFNKYGKDMEISFKEYFVGDKAPASQKDLKEILSGLISKKEEIESKKRKSTDDKEEIGKLGDLIKMITQDLEQLHQLGSEKNSEDKNKKYIENEIVKNNEELARFREALRSLTDANKSILNKIEKNTSEINNNIKDINNAIHSSSEDGRQGDSSNTSSTTDTPYTYVTQEENGENNDEVNEQTEELKKQSNIFVEISKKIDQLNNSNNDDNNDNENLGDDNNDNNNDDNIDIDEQNDELNEQVNILDREENAVDGIKQDFDDLRKIIDDKNTSLEKENDLIESEENKIEGAISKFREMHDNVQDINTDLKDGQDTLSKLKIPSSSDGGKSGAAWSFLTSSLETAFDLTLGISDRWDDIEDHAFKYGRALGMSAQQMRNYQKSLFNDEMQDMVGKYGTTMEQLRALQEGFTESTGRAVVMSREQMEAMAATSKYIDPATVNDVADKISEMGGSIVTSQEYLASTMARAQASGLNMAKHSKNFANNIKLASKYNFKRGLDDISKMTALTDRWKVNLGSFAEGLSASFENIESSISTAAKLQVLGGPMAAYMSNPLEMMNMTQTDMAGLMERFQDSIKDVGKFNKQSGVIELSPMDRAILKEQAKALNLNFDEVLNVINSEGKASAIESQINSIAKFNDTQKEWLKNVAEYDSETQKWYVTYHDKDGNRQRKDVNDIRSSDELNQYIQSEFSVEEKIQSDVHAIREHLLGRVKEKASSDAVSSLKEKQDSTKDRFELALVDMLDPAKMIERDLADVVKDGIPLIVKYVKNIADWVGGLSPAKIWNSWMDSASESSSFKWMQNLKMGDETANYIDNKVMPATGGLIGIGIIGGILAAFKSGTNLLFKKASNGLGKTIKSAGSKIGNIAKSVGGKLSSTAKGVGKGIKNLFSRGLTGLGEGAGGRLGSTGAKMLKGASKGLKIGGAAEAIFTAVRYGMNSQEANEQKNAVRTAYGSTNLEARLMNKNSFYEEARAEAAIEKEERKNNAIATTSAIGGILGSTVGGALGSLIGPGVATTAGGIFGGMAGAAIGEAVGEAIAPAIEETSNFLFGKSEKEQLGTEGVAQEKFETTKIGLQNIKTKDDLFQQAALATIGIHDLLISKFNIDNGKLSDGKEKDRGLIGNTTHTVKNFFGNLLGFNEGGIVHNGSENLDAPNGDTTVIAATENEMILTREQQSRLFAIANGEESARPRSGLPNSTTIAKQIGSTIGGHIGGLFGASNIQTGSMAGEAIGASINALVNPIGAITDILSNNVLYNKPTYISEKNSSAFNSIGNVSNGGIGGNNTMSFAPLNININGTLKLEGGNGQSKNIDINEIVNNTTLIRMLSEAIDRNTRTVFNGGSYNGEHSAWKLSKV